MIDLFFLVFSSIAATASVIGAIFAIWRWDYAKKSFELQEKQIYLQILMLAESREYWYIPKMEYVKIKKLLRKNADKEIDDILNELRSIFNAGQRTR